MVSSGTDYGAVAARSAGVSAGTVGDAAAADIIVIAVPWDQVPAAVQGLEWNSQIMKSCRQPQSFAL